MACAAVRNNRRAVQRRLRAGGIMMLVCLILPVLLILTAFVINLAWIDLSRTQTFIAADAATRAAGRTFAMTGDLAQAKAKAREIALFNTVAGRSISISDSDFTLGQSVRSGNGQRYQFTPGGANPNALRVAIKKLDASTNGSVPLIFPNFLSTSKYEFEKSSVSTRVDVDIALVLDRSGSMIYAANEAATGFPPAANPNWRPNDPVPPNARWIDLAIAANGFINEMQNSVLDENVSLVTYGTDVAIDSPIVGNYGAIQGGIARYTSSFPPGKTNIGDGIFAGLISLGGTGARSSASKVIILMTDGRLNAPPGARDPEAVAREAARQGVVVFTITFADEADQALMQRVAALGAGRHFHADSGTSLKQVLETIVRLLPSVLTE